MAELVDPPASVEDWNQEVQTLAKLRGACQREKYDYVRRRCSVLMEDSGIPFDYIRVLPRPIEDRLSLIFDRLDRYTGTRRGVLGSHNLTIAVGGSQRELDSMLTCMDVTGDGKVTIEDWMCFFHRLWEESNEKVLALLGSMEGHIAHYEAMLPPAGSYTPCLPREVEEKAESVFKCLDVREHGVLYKAQVACRGEEAEAMFSKRLTQTVALNLTLTGYGRRCSM